MIGAFVVLGGDISTWQRGLILAYGAGVYIHIAASEALPRVYEIAKSFKLKFYSLLSFIFGAVAIGLVLLDHEHCSPGGGDGGNGEAASDPHAGHNH